MAKEIDPKFTIAEPDLEKVKRLQAKLPERYREVPLLPVPEDEIDVLEKLKGAGIYYILTYGGGILEIIPGVGKWLGKALNLYTRYIGMKPQKIL